MNEVRDNVNVFIKVTERVGVPTILCLIFGYLYFVKIEKLIQEVGVTQYKVVTASQDSQSNVNDIKKDIRRLRKKFDEIEVIQKKPVNLKELYYK